MGLNSKTFYVEAAISLIWVANFLNDDNILFIASNQCIIKIMQSAHIV